jgi:hypothetical protein
VNSFKFLLLKKNRGNKKKGNEQEKGRGEVTCIMCTTSSGSSKKEKKRGKKREREDQPRSRDLHRKQGKAAGGRGVGGWGRGWTHEVLGRTTPAWR